MYLLQAREHGWLLFVFGFPPLMQAEHRGETDVGPERVRVGSRTCAFGIGTSRMRTPEVTEVVREPRHRFIVGRRRIGANGFGDLRRNESHPPRGRGSPLVKTNRYLRATILDIHTHHGLPQFFHNNSGSHPTHL